MTEINSFFNNIANIGNIDSIDNITKITSAIDNLTCFICAKIIENPQILPCCGNIACSFCLNSWFDQHPICPFCRSNIQGQKLISFHWMDSLYQFLRHINQPPVKEKLCSKHHKKVDFYCQDCQAFICGDCIFDLMVQTDLDHYNHHLYKLSDYCKLIKSLLMKEILETSTLITKIQSALESILNYQQIVFQSKSKLYYNLRLYHKYQTKQTSDIFSEAKKENQKLLSFLNSINSQLKSSISTNLSDFANESLNANLIFQKIENLKHLLNSHSIHNLILKFDEIEKKNRDLSTLQIKEIQVPLFVHEFIIIHNYPQLIENQKTTETPQIIFSNPFYVHGNRFRAKIFPSGNSNAKNTHLSFFLDLIQGSGKPSTYTYKIEILPNEAKNNQNIPIISRQYTSDFEVNNSWGWNKILKIDSILNNGYLNENGDLKIKVSLKAESYFQINRDQNFAINQLKKKIQEDFDIDNLENNYESFSDDDLESFSNISENSID